MMSLVNARVKSALEYFAVVNMCVDVANEHGPLRPLVTEAWYQEIRAEGARTGGAYARHEGDTNQNVHDDEDEGHEEDGEEHRDREEDEEDHRDR